MPARKTKRRKKVAPGSVGLAAADTKITNPAPELRGLSETVEADGGAVLGAYADPFGGKAVLLVALPIDLVEPTPYQRDPSENHVKRLMTVIEKIGRFLDPIIAIRQDDRYWTPNGSHRLKALKKLGARSVTALLVPESDVAFKILALNTEKAHNLREKSLEAIRMARALAERGELKESDYVFEFEQAPFLTLGLCYEKRPRISGGAYHPVLKRVDDFLEHPVSRALSVREKRAAQVLELDDAVSEVAGKLKERGFTSPYLKPYVVARVNPTRFSKSTSFDFDEIFKKMIGSAKRFNVEKVRQEDLARIGGAPPAEE
jgi:ParB family transcriptional regulator, chromosome partitioning protein